MMHPAAHQTRLVIQNCAIPPIGCSYEFLYKQAVTTGDNFLGMARTAQKAASLYYMFPQLACTCVLGLALLPFDRACAAKDSLQMRLAVSRWHV